MIETWALLPTLLTGFGGGLLVGARRGLPFIKREPTDWAITLYEGESPLALRPSLRCRHPLLQARDVTDLDAELVADPFLYRYQQQWYLFFEVLNRRRQLGEIAYASSHDGEQWHYQRRVLSEPFHLSYPHLLRWQGEHYMIPESHQDESIRLYRATRFPDQWQLERRLLSGHPFVDSTPFYHQQQWWIFTSTPHNDQLMLYYADTLQGPWHAHPASPVVHRNARISRPAGRVLHYQGQLIRLAQDDADGYGRAVRAFVITHLSRHRYTEQPLSGKPLIAAAGGMRWNSRGMHHLDAWPQDDGRWIAAVDGQGRRYRFGWCWRRS